MRAALARYWTFLSCAAFALGVLALAAVAGERAAPFDPRERQNAVADFFSGHLAQEFESHYDAVFPARTFGVNLWAAINYNLFGEGRPGVVVGEDGWLYTQEEFRTWPQGQAQVRNHLALIPQVRQTLAKSGVSLLIAPVPAKARIYAEHRGGHRPAQIHESLYEDLVLTARTAGAVVPDLAEAMRQCKREVAVFLRTDTHWTPEGAHCAAQAIGREVLLAGLATREPRNYLTQIAPVTQHRGDLLGFLPLDPYFDHLLPAPDRVEIRQTQRAGDSSAQLFADLDPPQVALVGTSYSWAPDWNFAGALQEALGEEVINYASEGRGPFAPMREYLKSPDLRHRAPRLVIWEIPERYLPQPDEADRAAPGPSTTI